MTHVFFDPDSVNWTSYLESQEGKGKFFVGSKYQRGFGVFGRVGKFLMPIAKNIAESLLKEGVSTGSSVLKDIGEGKDMAQSLATHAKTGLTKVGQKMQQCGKGRKRVSTKKSSRKIQVIKRRPYDQLSFL